MAETVSNATTSKDVVPLSKNELLLGGISNIIIMILGCAWSIWFESAVTFDHTNINNQSDLNDFGVYVRSVRSSDITQGGVFTFVLPLYIFQYVAMIRVLKICFGKYHTLRTMFSLTYILYSVFIYIGNCVALVSDAFNWAITTDTDASNDILPSANMTELLIVRCGIMFLSQGIYCGAIAMVSFWLTFILVLFFDSKYNADLKIFIFPSCGNICGTITKILLIVLTIGTMLGSYLSVFAWNHTGFWSLSGGSQTFQIFTIFSSLIAGVWLIWFALSKNYEKFNDRIQFEQFL